MVQCTEFHPLQLFQAHKTLQALKNDAATHASKMTDVLNCDYAAAVNDADTNELMRMRDQEAANERKIGTWRQNPDDGLMSAQMIRLADEFSRTLNHHERGANKIAANLSVG